MGENVEDVVTVMISEEGKNEHYIRLISIFAGILNRNEENETKQPTHYFRGYRAAIEDMAMGFSSPAVRSRAEKMVANDLKRMRAANKADSDKRKAEMNEWGVV